MITLSAIASLKIDAETQFAAALEEVCRLALSTGGGVEPVARLRGFQRELAILHKQEVELLAHGKASAGFGAAESPNFAAEAAAAVVTRLGDSNAT